MFIPSRIGVLSSKCRLSFLAPREIPGSVARCPRGVVGCALPAELDPALAKKGCSLSPYYPYLIVRNFL